MIKIKKINKLKVVPINTPKIPPEKIKGYDMFPEIYSNIFLLGKRRHGKTNTIFTILKNCCNKSTRIVVFCSTAYNDASWKHIREYFKSKGNDIEIHTAVKEDGEDVLNNLVEELKQNEIDKEIALSKPKERKIKFIKFEDSSDDEEDKPKKEKKEAPEIIIVFDDMSKQLRSDAVFTLMKKNRHFKSKLILSSQAYKDLHPDSRENLDYMLIFGDTPEADLQEVLKDTKLKISWKLFNEIYNNAVSKKYSFLYCDIINNSFRKGFNKLYEIEK